MPLIFTTLCVCEIGKYSEIERENKILLEKMSNIMQDQKPKLYNPSKSHAEALILSCRAI